jgi:hypothetical protein
VGCVLSQHVTIVHSLWSASGLVGLDQESLTVHSRHGDLPVLRRTFHNLTELCLNTTAGPLIRQPRGPTGNGTFRVRPSSSHLAPTGRRLSPSGPTLSPELVTTGNQMSATFRPTGDSARYFGDMTRMPVHQGLQWTFGISPGPSNRAAESDGPCYQAESR